MLSQKRENQTGPELKPQAQIIKKGDYIMTQSERIILPEDVIPRKYKVFLEPNLETFTFDGEVDISVELINSTDRITLNAAELTIFSTSTQIGADTILGDSLECSDDETITIYLGRQYSPCKATVKIRFSGELNDRLLGFYRSQYLDVNGETRYLAATQFESTDARRAFPCWDEPERKATFDVTLKVAQDLTAISNMPVANVSNDGPNTKTITFEETPIMSTYLIAFIVGDLKCVEKTSKHGTLMRVWATSGNESKGEYALQTSLDLLDFYNDYFGIKFPLPKLDHLAIPDFAAGAMENWGAITYREVALLVDPENSSAGTRQIVASIISHEMAHMWFGDLVTMKWWNDLWLNESFASWMGDKAVDAIHPEWDVWTQFLTADTASAFSLDGLANSHPIEQEVNNPAEIGQLFDAISYSKGGSVLRMLEDYIGPESFRVGIRNYLTKHSYSNAETSDLWNALGEASGKPVSEVMNSWVQQTGFPVLNVSKSKTGFSFSQNKFLFENIAADNNHTTTWQIPVKISTSEKSPAAVHLMKKATDIIQVPDNYENWYKVNPDQTGFYRVKYSADDLARLETAVRNGELGGKDRLGLQGDAYALCKAGYTNVSSFLSLAESYSNETEAPVLSDLAGSLRGIDNLIFDQPYHDQFKEFCLKIFEKPGRRAGWDKSQEEGHLDALYRSTALSNLGHFGDDETLFQASERFSMYVNDPETIHPDIRSVVFSLAAQEGDTDTYELMWKLEKQAELQEEKVRFHGALSSFSAEELLQETLKRSLTDDIRAQDTIRVIVSVSSSAKGRVLAWDFLRENWEELDRRYGDGGFALMRLVSLVSGFSSLERLDEVETFFAANPTPAAERTIEQAKERIKLNSAWVDKYSKELATFLK